MWSIQRFISGRMKRGFLPHPVENNQNRFPVYDPFMLWLTDNDQVLTLDHFQKHPVTQK